MHFSFPLRYSHPHCGISCFQEWAFFFFLAYLKAHAHDVVFSMLFSFTISLAHLVFRKDG